MTTTREWVSK